MLREIFKKNKWWIGFTYCVLLLEFLIFALVPYLLGKAVDGLLQQDYHSFGVYVALSTVGLVIGFFRRRFDTRIFMRIWRDKATDTVKDMNQRGVDSTKVVSRYRLVGTYADFFEFTLPTSISSMMEIAVSLFMIWLVLPWGSLFVLILALLAMLSYYYFSFQIQKTELEIQKLREKTDAAIVAQDMSTIDADFEEMRQKWVKRSDLDAYSWSVNDILAIVAEVAILILVVVNGHSVGTIMSTLTYVYKLFERTGLLSFYFNHVKQIEMVDGVLKDT